MGIPKAPDEKAEWTFPKVCARDGCNDLPAYLGAPHCKEHKSTTPEPEGEARGESRATYYNLEDNDSRMVPADENGLWAMRGQVLARDKRVDSLESQLAQFEKLKTFVQKVARHQCMATTAENIPCDIHSDPDPEVYCLPCLATEALAAIEEGQ